MVTKDVIHRPCGESIHTLTTDGIVNIILDIMKIILSVMLIWYYPKGFSDITGESKISQWISCVLLLMVIVLIFLPALTRLMFGRYSHYIIEDTTKEE
jgi:hypothetical protein